MDREKIAGITPEQIRAFRLRAHHLDRKLPPGARDGIHPTFTSFRRWTGHMPAVPPDAEKRLVQKFLHAHGPADVSAFRSVHAHFERRRSPPRAVWGLTGRRRYGCLLYTSIWTRCG